MPTPQYFSASTQEMISQVRKRYPHISRDRENELFETWQAKESIKARDELVLGHMDLMVKMVHRVLGYGISADDLLGQAVQGMQRALKGYDPSRGFRFGTFARAWIKDSMMTYIQTNVKMIHGPQSSSNKMMFYHLRRLRAEMNIQGAVTEQDAVAIRERLMLTVPSASKLTVNSIMESDYYMSSSMTSASCPMGEDGSRTILDNLSNDDELVEDVLAERDEVDQKSNMLQQAMKLLNPRQLDIFTQRKLAEPNKTLEELGNKYKVSRERIRQIEKHALKIVSTSMHKMVVKRDEAGRALVEEKAREVAEVWQNRPSWTNTKALKGRNSLSSLVKGPSLSLNSRGKIAMSDEELALRRSLATFKGNMSRTPEQRRLISIKGAETTRRKRAEAAENGVILPNGPYSKMMLSEEEVRRRCSMTSKRGNMSRTPEQRRLISIKGNMSRTPEQRRLISIKAAETVRRRKQTALAQ